MRRLRLCLLALIASASLEASLQAHDIPNARVDRGIQATVEPGVLKIDYEVGLSELTLTQELRVLIGALPGGGTDDWFRTYGEETGILNARGFLVTVDGKPIDLQVEGFKVVVEVHPKFTFSFRGVIPESGRLSIQDTNFVSSQGSSRFAIQGVGTTLEGDDRPAVLADVQEKPLWQMTDEEERASRTVRVSYRVGSNSIPVGVAAPKVERSAPPDSLSSLSLSRLLNRNDRGSIAWLIATAFFLGALHSLQPGHGKTLIAASSLGSGRGAVVAVTAALTHTVSVALVAAALWITGTTRFAEIHLVLLRATGFAIAAIGLWRLGNAFGAPRSSEVRNASVPSTRSAFGVGVAAGIVPCWDAVGLLVVASILGRLGMGILLAGIFNVGMATVLLVLSVLVSRFRKGLSRYEGRFPVEKWSSIASGVLLSILGIYLLDYA